MAQFQNEELEYVVDDYFDVAEFEDNDAFAENQLRGSQDADSNFEDDFDEVKTDTSAMEARNGKDIQGIPWESLTSPEIRTTRASLALVKTSKRDALHCLPFQIGILFGKVLLSQGGKSLYPGRRMLVNHKH
ncbi:unnamed protein product [Prunus armeniaca]|uniref:Uncharacterized protein n=1 Tax=Prunus armeniaca TaxID=36596 RepID=A0A6J5TET8_PRUAR|nr:unnamed protein product [Prunus armeniaca]